MRIHHFVRIPQATVNSTSRHSHQANVVSVHLLVWQGALCAATSPQGECLRLAAGLFACEDIEEGTVVACFGAVRQLREGEEGTRTRLAYSFIVKEREGKSLTITPKHGVTETCMAHAINHTCHPGFANCRFVHAGIVGGWSEDKQGGIGGRRTSEVFVKTTRRVESDAELFERFLAIEAWGF